MSEKAARSEVSGAFSIWKSIIGRFSNRKWAKRPPDRRFQAHFLFESRSYVLSTFVERSTTIEELSCTATKQILITTTVFACLCLTSQLFTRLSAPKEIDETHGARFQVEEVWRSMTKFRNTTSLVQCIGLSAVGSSSYLYSFGDPFSASTTGDRFRLRRLGFRRPATGEKARCRDGAISKASKSTRRREATIAAHIRVRTICTFPTRRDAKFSISFHWWWYWWKSSFCWW